MDRSNLEDALKLARNEEDRRKVELILPDAEVPDPYWGEHADFEDVYKLLDDASKKIAAELLQS